MAVYERTYRPYRGELTSTRSRFLILPRYAYREVFNSKLFLLLYLGSFFVPLAMALLIYLPHNLGAIETYPVVKQIVAGFKFDRTFFLWFLRLQGGAAFLLSLVAGPELVSRDLGNNGLPLYLARPFSRTEYVAGKMSVLIFLLSTVTWIPGMLLFGLQSYLAGWDWLREFAVVGVAVFVGSWIWILFLSLLSLALSAYLRWKPLAQAAMLGVLIASWFLAGAIRTVTGTVWGSLIDVFALIGTIWKSLLGLERSGSIPLAGAWLALLAIFALCLALLARRVRAYEVVR